MNYGNFNDLPWYFNILNEQIKQCCCGNPYSQPPVDQPSIDQPVQLFPCIHCGTHTSNRYLGQPCCEECAKYS